MYTDCVGVCARRVLTHLFKVAISVNGTELHNSGHALFLGRTCTPSWFQLYLPRGNLK